MPTLTAPARRFRIIRGESAHYRSHTYTTKERRDAAAARFAALDNDTVLTELWDESHPQDGLNRGWACDGAAQPPGTPQEPETGDERGPASAILPDDTVTVFAHPAGRFGQSLGADVSGDVANVVGPIRLPGTNSPGVRLTIDGRDFEAIDTAATTWHGYHDPRPTDDPDEEAVCRYCGRDVTWMGPNPESDWLHVADPANRLETGERA